MCFFSGFHLPRRWNFHTDSWHRFLCRFPADFPDFSLTFWHFKNSEAWEPPRFQEKRSRSGKAILGALGEFRGILGAALGIGNSILGIRNSILGMASHDLINTKPTILGATLGAIPGIAANPPERFSFAPSFSEHFFENWGGPRAQDKIGVPESRQKSARKNRRPNGLSREDSLLHLRCLVNAACHTMAARPKHSRRACERPSWHLGAQRPGFVCSKTFQK